MLSEICRENGILQIEEAVDGFTALEKCQQWKPDLVLLDMHMPNMDGIQATAELKRLGLLEDMVVIMVTTFDNPDVKIRAFEAGITDFIPKPINSAEVMARSLAHLERLYFHRCAAADYKRIQHELSEAIILQNVLLPTEELLDDIRRDNELDIAHYYHPATELAGDYLSVRKLEDKKTALLSADISGHGVTAALYSFSLHSLLTDKFLERHEPDEILKRTNAQLHMLMKTGKFATLFLGIVDTQNHELRYAAAAAPAPLFYSQGCIHKLDTAGYLLGAQKEASYALQRRAIQAGDILFIYSDALVETVDNKGNNMALFEIEALLKRHAHKEASHIIHEIISAFYTNDRQLSDDLSMLICKR